MHIPKSKFVVIIVAASVVSIVITGLAVGLGVYFGTKSSDDVPAEQTTTDGYSTSTTPIGDDTTDRDVLLPTAVLPYHYQLHLRPDIYDNDPEKFTFNGTVRILVNVVQPTTNITLHVKRLTIDVGAILIEDLVSGELVELSGTPTEIASKEFYIMHLTETLQAGRNYSITMKFNAPLLSDLAGLYYSTYEDIRGKHYIVTSQIALTDARKVFPCFDEMAMKATFDVALDRRGNLTTLSNTVIYETKNSGDWITDYYTTTPPMSTYLLAFIVSDFECLKDLNGTTDVWICARPTAIDQADLALQVARPLMKNFENYFSISFPLNRMVHCAVPDFPAGAMENWGLVVYRETSLLYDPFQSSASARQRVVSVIAHELAHQWFGNLVTPQWWDDIWLNEGFASYMEYPSVHNIYPEWDMEGQFLSLDLHSVMQVDGLSTSHKIYQEAYTTAEISQLFDRITYSKGASIIRMMKYFLGEDVFQQGLSTYLKNRAYQNAHHLDLFQTLTQEATDQGKNINVTEVMLTWILQMGYPVVSLSYDSTSGEVTVTQQHFLLDPSQNITELSPFGYRWVVPINFVNDQNHTEPEVYFAKDQTEVFTTDAGAKWIIGNKQQRFYYRVNYDDNMWSALSQQLYADHNEIDEVNRAQLLDDVFKLSRAGLISPTTALDLTVYLQNETDYLPWTAAASNVAYLKVMLEFDQDYHLLETYMQNQLQTVYSEVGFAVVISNDQHLLQLKQVQILNIACQFSMTACQTTAYSNYKQWMDNYNGTNSIDVNIRYVTYCYGIGQGGTQEWYFAWERYKEANVAAEKTVWLQALACAKDEYLLDNYLQLAINEQDIRRQDFQTVIVSIAQNVNGRNTAWNFLRLNWNLMIDRFGESFFTLTNIVAGVTSGFSTQQKYTELDTFYTSNSGNLGTSERAFQQALEATKANIAWRSVNELPIFDWLRSHISA